MRPLLPLGGVALALVLSGCGEPGLEFRTPSDAREYVRLCARKQTDIYCKALMPTLRKVQGPVSVIFPNGPSGGFRESLTRLLAPRGLTVADFQRDPSLQAALARANIFPLGRLSTGTHRTLDGKAHQVRCWPDVEPPKGENWCEIGELRGFNDLHYFQNAVGSMFFTMGQTRDDLSFFPF